MPLTTTVSADYLSISSKSYSIHVHRGSHLFKRLSDIWRKTRVYFKGCPGKTANESCWFADLGLMYSSKGAVRLGGWWSVWLRCRNCDNHRRSFAGWSIEVEHVCSLLLWGGWCTLRVGCITLYKSTHSWTLMLSWDPAYLLLIPATYPEAKCFLAWLWTNRLTICIGLVFGSHVPFMSRSVCHPAVWNTFCTGVSMGFLEVVFPPPLLVPILKRRRTFGSIPLPRRSGLMRSKQYNRALNQSWFNQLYRWHLETTESLILIVLIIRCS